jgi:hypothetical protein
MPEIRDDYYRWRITLCGALVLLLLAEVLPFVFKAISENYRQGQSTSGNPVEEVIYSLFLLGGPLLVLAAGVLFSRKIGLLSFLGLSSLATGIVVIVGLYFGDPSGGVMKILSILVYWAAGFITLFTFSGNDSD